MIKKIFLLSIIFLMTAITVFADIVPKTSKSIRHYGIGLLKIEKDFDVYANTDVKSKKLYQFNVPVKKKTTAIVKDTRKIVNPYIVSIPSEQEFYVAVSDYPENGWIKIYYNQNGKETGWVKLSDKKDYLTWKEFVYKFGKKNGLFIMRDIPSTDYKLYSQDSEDSQVVDDFTYPQYMALRMIRGNWMLVTVVDSGNVYKTGWFCWRSDNGKLRVFPNMR